MKGYVLNHLMDNIEKKKFDYKKKFDFSITLN